MDQQTKTARYEDRAHTVEHMRNRGVPDHVIEDLLDVEIPLDDPVEAEITEPTDADERCVEA